MIQALQILPQTLTNNEDNVIFTTIDLRSRSANCCGWLQYTPGSKTFTLLGGGDYLIMFNANVTGPAGQIVMALKNQNGDVEGTEMDTTIATEGEYENISFQKLVRLCPRVNTSYSIGSLATLGGVTPAVESEIPTLKDGNLIFIKLH